MQDIWTKKITGINDLKKLHIRSIIFTLKLMLFGYFSREECGGRGVEKMKNYF
jgi:hypothetical protein